MHARSVARDVVLDLSRSTRVFMPPERFELPTPWFEARCSRPLSYDGVRSSPAAPPTRGEWSTARAPKGVLVIVYEASGIRTRTLPADNRML